MKIILACVVAISGLSVAVPVYADPDKNENGNGGYKHQRHVHKGSEYKEEYWDGNCKVERKWERNGKYKEERKCEGHRPHYSEHPAPGVVIYPPAVVIQPSIIVR